MFFVILHNCCWRYDRSYYFADLARNRSTNCKVQGKGVSKHFLMAYGGLEE